MRQGAVCGWHWKTQPWQHILQQALLPVLTADAIGDVGGCRKSSSQGQELAAQRGALAEAEKRGNEIQMVMVQMSTKMEESRRVMVDKIRLADARGTRVRQLQDTGKAH